MVVLQLKLEAGKDPIAGTVSAPGGQRWPFEGYVALIVALEHARHAEDSLAGAAQASTADERFEVGPA